MHQIYFTAAEYENGTSRKLECSTKNSKGKGKIMGFNEQSLVSKKIVPMSVVQQILVLFLVIPIAAMAASSTSPEILSRTLHDRFG